MKTKLEILGELIGMPADHVREAAQGIRAAKTSSLQTLLGAASILADNDNDGWVDELCTQVPCEILGCGKTASEAQMRTFRLGDAPVKCCPECWDAMEIPRDCRDTANLSQHNVRARAPLPAAAHYDHGVEG